VTYQSLGGSLGTLPTPDAAQGQTRQLVTVFLATEHLVQQSE
jgi:hypothetical protein